MNKKETEKRNNWIVFSLENPSDSAILYDETKESAKAWLEKMNEEDQAKHKLYPFDRFTSLATEILMEMKFEYWNMDETTSKTILKKIFEHLYHTEELGLSVVKQHLNLSAFADDSEIIEALKKNDH